MGVPSDNREKRMVAMFDSFSKTVARNFSRNLKRAKENRDKHFSEEPIDYILELLSHEDRYPSDYFVLLQMGYPAWSTVKLYIKHSFPYRKNSRRYCCLTSGMI